MCFYFNYNTNGNSRYKLCTICQNKVTWRAVLNADKTYSQYKNNMPNKQEKACYGKKNSRKKKMCSVSHLMVSVYSKEFNWAHLTDVQILNFRSFNLDT